MEFFAVHTQNADIDAAGGEKLDVRHAEDQPGLSSEAFRRRSVSDTWTFIRQKSKYSNSITLITFEKKFIIVFIIL